MSRTMIWVGVAALAGCTMEDASIATNSKQSKLGAGDVDVDRNDLHASADDCPVGTPSTLAPAADADLAFVLNAQGVQRYTCVGSTTGFAWTFIAPDADLFAPNPRHLEVHHFAGPTWVHRDSSSVGAAKAAGATVDATAIPWLLLNVNRHGGEDGRMTDIAQIQRLETTGGNAPATGCDADHVGAEADVLYTARYFFYRTSDRPNRVRCGG